jgi:hypothetical protein
VTGDWAGSAAWGAQADKLAAHKNHVTHRIVRIRAAKWLWVKRDASGTAAEFVEENARLWGLHACLRPAIVPPAIKLGWKWPL